MKNEEEIKNQIVEEIAHQKVNCNKRELENLKEFLWQLWKYADASLSLLETEDSLK